MRILFIIRKSKFIKHLPISKKPGEKPFLSSVLGFFPAMKSFFITIFILSIPIAYISYVNYLISSDNDTSRSVIHKNSITYYRPHDSNIWIDNYPAVIKKGDIVDVYYSGLKQFKKCEIEIWDEYSIMISERCNCSATHKSIKLSNVHPTDSAYLKMRIGEFYFTSFESYAIQ